MSKQDAGNAERAAEHYAREVLGCVKTVRAVRTRFQRQDLFGCDCIGVRENGSKVFLQVTSSEFGHSGNVAARRRKLEQIPWLQSDTVQLLEMRREKVGNRIAYRFRVHVYGNGIWVVVDDAFVPREWFRAWRPTDD